MVQLVACSHVRGACRGWYATGIPSNPNWTKAYNTSSGALLNAYFDGFGGFGSFCVVILALGAIQNNTPSTYVAALSI